MAEHPATTGSGSPARLVLALSITQTVGYGVLFYAFGVLLAPMLDELGWSAAVLSAGPSVALVVAAVGAPSVGRRIDAFGARGVMTAGSVLGGLGVLGWASAGHPVVYLVAWVAIGIAMATTLYPPAFAAVVHHAPGSRRSAVLAITVSAGFAVTIFAPFTTLLAELMGWRSGLVVLAGVLTGLTAPLHWWGLPGATRVPRHVKTAVDQPGAVAAPGAPSLRGERRLARLALASALGKAAPVAVGVHLVAFLLAQGRSPGLAAALAGGVGAAKVLGRLLVGLLVREDAAGVALRTGFAFQALALAVAIALPAGGPESSLGDIALVVMFGFGAGAVTVAHPLFVAEAFGTAHYGLVGGRVQRVAQLAEAATPLAIGALVTSTGSYEVAWVVLAASCAVAAGVLPATQAGTRTPSAPRQ